MAKFLQRMNVNKSKQAFAPCIEKETRFLFTISVFQLICLMTQATGFLFYAWVRIDVYRLNCMYGRITSQQ